MKILGKLYHSKIDSYPPGEMGKVQELFILFEPLTNLRPYCEYIQVCSFCQFKNTIKTRFALPIKIHDLGDPNFNSVQDYYNWYFDDQKKIQCEVCHQSSLQITTRYERKPDFIIFELLCPGDKQNFVFDKILVDDETKERYYLAATINNPSINHFNCSVFEPFLKEKVILKKQWVLHDGLIMQGKLQIIQDEQYLWIQKPIFLFYCKI